MTDTGSSYASSPEMPHRIYAPVDNFYHNAPKSIIGAAGDGFRLSLELQLIGQQPVFREDLASADIEIQMIIKKISEFSLMLKQVGKIMDESRTIASQAAIDTATDIKRQSEQDFDEIKNMIEIVQKRDENGHLSGIEVAERVTLSFKKRKMQYLLGQLEYLKDSLAIMLQTLELGKEIASAQYVAPSPAGSPQLTCGSEGRTQAPSWKAMRQERAEIQNMIVVQHWSFAELEKLYKLAEKEALLEIDSSRQESPPPSYDAANPSPANTTLTITVGTPPGPQKEAEHPNALVPFTGERSLEVMKTSMEQASAREEKALSAQVNDIVDHLLDEWTEVGNEERYGRRRQIQAPSRSGRAGHMSRRAHVESDDSDSSASDTEYERSENIGGFYLEGPKNAVKKNVRFNPRVDDEIDEDELRPRRTTRKHTLGRVGEYSSDSDSDSDDFSSASPVVERRASNRRSSNSSTGSHHPPFAPSHDRTRRPYGGPSSVSSHENQPAPPGSRGMPYSPQSTQARPMPVHGQTWTGPGATPGQLRPPQPPGPARQPSGGPYGSPSAYSISPSPGASPVTPSGSFFSRDPNFRGPPPQGGPYGPHHAPVDRSRQRQRERIDRRRPVEQRPVEQRPVEQRQEQKKKDESNASRNIKKGIFGGTAIAGILELLQGLDGL